ncbi:siderophore-interacting protein [Nocardioides sp.]|uniref:siderophore-interacting protein n=1 Tax=Nocardioides sp. TaxID=35761 RepID=UPI0039E26B5D
MFKRAGTRQESWLKEWPIRVRQVEVLRRTQVTPRMIRLTFGGPGLAGFESHVPDEHVKILFPDPDGSLRVPEPDGDHLHWPRPRPISREYTVRRYDEQAGELDLDFVLHGHGLASAWARDVTPGTPVWIAGPPRGWVVPDCYDFYVIAGDHTALPAIARFVAELPRSATGQVGVLVPDAAEEQPLELPDGVTVTWLHRAGSTSGPADALADFLAPITPPAGSRPYLWCAGEQRILKPARGWGRRHGLGRHDQHITGYWRAGRVGDFAPGESDAH